MKTRKNKKAISLMVSYVLLIIIALGLAAVIYPRIRNIVPENSEECDTNTALSIRSYSCAITQDQDDVLFLEIENKGFFSVDGFFIRAADTDEGILNISLETRDVEKEAVIAGRYNFDINEKFLPEEKITANFSIKPYEKITKIQLQPFIYGEKSGRLITCDNIITLDIDNCKNQKQLPISNEDLAGFWSFDNSDETDSSGQNTADIIGDLSFVDGKVGKAAEFTGVGSGYIEVNPNSFNFEDEDFTISFWVKLDQDVTSIIFDMWPSAGIGRWNIKNMNGKIYFRKYTDPKDNDNLKIASDTNAWQFITIGRRGTKGFSCLNDNDCIEEDLFAADENLGLDSKLIMGCDQSGSNCLDGKIDEITIFKKALSEPEIAQLYGS